MSKDVLILQSDDHVVMTTSAIWLEKLKGVAFTFQLDVLKSEE